MKFYKQEKPGICQLTALQHVLSYFSEDSATNEIAKHLPKHTFGNFISELGVFLHERGFETVLISNQVPFTSTNKPFLKSLEDYKQIGAFKEEAPNEGSFEKFSLALINVDWYKIRPLEGPPGGHYVVLKKEGEKYYVYDGSNYTRKVEKYFDHMVKASMDINRYHENGMWLFIR